MIRHLGRACAAETMKLRGTLALAMALVAPLVVVLLFGAQLLLMPVPADASGGGQAWQLLSEGVLGLWCFLMLPLYITLQAALLANVEHANRQWKHLLALPVPRPHHFLAKGWALALLSCASAVMLYLAILLAGQLLPLLRPSLGFHGTAPWQPLSGAILAATAASALMAVLQLFIALRARSFTLAVGVGMAAAVSGFMVGQSHRYGPLYPWTMPLHTTTQDGQYQWTLAVAGLASALVLGGLLAAWLGRYPPE